MLEWKHGEKDRAKMISLVFCGDLKYCPYIRRYIEIFKENREKYEVVFWNRSGDRYNLPDNYRSYDVASDLRKSRIFKISDFYGFRKWLINYLDHTECDKFVLLSTLTGVLIGSELIKQRAKYIFDIRDFSYENVSPYYAIEKKVIMNSFQTVISSPAFRAFLPKNYDYIIAHNFNRNDIPESMNSCKEYSLQEKIRIVWNGMIRYFDYQSELIRGLANDNRFELFYHGDGPGLNYFKDFCKKNGINNVFFTGAYDYRDTYKLLDNATLINNFYGYNKNEGKKLKYAVSNKFYDGLIYHIPQIVEGKGYKADLVKKYGLGIVLDLEKDIREQITNYLKSFNRHIFIDNCNALLSKVIEEDNRYVQLIDTFSRL